jgi:hypothetical protein
MGDISKTKEKKIDLGTSISTEPSSHQTGDAAFAPATPQDLQHSKASRLKQLTQHATHESKKNKNTHGFV